MPGVSKETASPEIPNGPVDARHEEIGDYTIDFVSFRESIDGTPFLKGLPDDRCQSPHWGYVLNGRLTFRFADHDEVFVTGDAFYLPPGHAPLADAGSEYVQFSPTADIRRTSEVMMRNMQAAQMARAG